MDFSLNGILSGVGQVASGTGTFLRGTINGFTYGQADYTMFTPVDMVWNTGSNLIHGRGLTNHRGFTEMWHDSAHTEKLETTRSGRVGHAGENFGAGLLGIGVFGVATGSTFGWGVVPATALGVVATGTSVMTNRSLEQETLLAEAALHPHHGLPPAVRKPVGQRL